MGDVQTEGAKKKKDLDRELVSMQRLRREKSCNL